MRGDPKVKVMLQINKVATATKYEMKNVLELPLKESSSSLSSSSLPSPQPLPPLPPSPSPQPPLQQSQP